MNGKNAEKASIVYYMVRRENGEQVDECVLLGSFLETYEHKFSMISENPYKNITLKKDKKSIIKSRKKQFAEIHNLLSECTLEEILEYRNKYIRVKCRKIPENLWSKAKAKHLYIILKKDTDTNLSGFNIFYDNICITTRPWRLAKHEVETIIDKFPATKEELIKKENALIELLFDETARRTTKISALKKFNMIYTTNDFQIKMNKYLLAYCTDKGLAIEAINLCAKAGIVDLINNKPFMLQFCKADSTAKRKFIKRLKSARGNQRKGKR